MRREVLVERDEEPAERCRRAHYRARISRSTPTSCSLARIWGDDALEQRGVGVLRLMRDAMVRAPTAFGWLLVALDQYLAQHRELAIVGPRDAPVAQAALATVAPTDVVAFGPDETIPLLAGRLLVEGRPAVYVCERFACRVPVTDAASFDASAG